MASIKIKYDNKEYFVSDLIDTAMRRPAASENNIDAKEALNRGS